MISLRPDGKVQDCGYTAEQRGTILEAGYEIAPYDMVEHMCELHKKLDSMSMRIDEMAEKLDKVPGALGVMAHKIEISQKGFGLFVRDNKLVARDKNYDNTKTAKADFTDCQAFEGIATVEQLREFEKFVEAPIIRTKMMRFVQDKIPPCVYKDGKAFFTAAFRLLLNTSVILPYVWKSAQGGKKAFKFEFAPFVSFMTEMTKSEYKNMNDSAIESAFSERFQYKMSDHSREIKRGGKQQRKTCTKMFSQRTTKINENNEVAQKDDGNVDNSAKNNKQMTGSGIDEFIDVDKLDGSDKSQNGDESSHE